MCHSFNPTSKQAVISAALLIQGDNCNIGSCECLILQELDSTRSADPTVLVCEYSECSGANTPSYGFKRTTLDLLRGGWNAYRQEMLYYFWQANQQMDGRI